MTDLKVNSQHISAADLAALKAADPAAFDLDGDAPASSAPAPGTPEALAAALAGGAPAAPATEPAAPAAAAPVVPVVVDPSKPAAPVMIPKARLDEVIVDSKNKDVVISERDRVIAEQAARIAALEAAPAAAPAAPAAIARDFDAEHAVLLQRYNDAELDMAEFHAEKRKLDREEIQITAAAIAAQTVDARQQATETAKVQDAFVAADAAWTAANEAFLAQPGADAAMQAAIEAVDKQTGFKLEPVELMNRAGAVAAAMLAASNGTPAVPANPHAARNALDAAAQARAGSTPAPLTGGMGDRGAANAVDLTTLKPGDFGKLSKADQDKALYGEHA